MIDPVNLRIPMAVSSKVTTPEIVPPDPKGALVYGILQGFANLESRYFACCDLDGFTCPWVASHTGRA